MADKLIQWNENIRHTKCETQTLVVNMTPPINCSWLFSFRNFISSLTLVPTQSQGHTRANHDSSDQKYKSDSVYMPINVWRRFFFQSWMNQEVGNQANIPPVSAAQKAIFCYAFCVSIKLKKGNLLMYLLPWLFWCSLCFNTTSEGEPFDVHVTMIVLMQSVFQYNFRRGTVWCTHHHDCFDAVCVSIQLQKGNLSISISPN